MNPRRLYFVAYQDDGAAGAGAQDVARTHPWNRLYTFDTPKAMLDFIHDVAHETHRLNARVIGYWATDDDNYPLVADWSSNRTPDDFRRMRRDCLDSYAPATLIEGSE